MTSEEKLHQDAITEINGKIGALMKERADHERAVHKTRARAKLADIDISSLALAARHITPGEGPLEVGYSLKQDDIAAIVKVVAFVAAYLEVHGTA